MEKPSLFEQLGGEPKLRVVIDEFIDRVFDDVMIGFFFKRASRERVKAKEYEFAAAHLGADVEYTGRPIAAAHAAHPIMGGQFMRRLKILQDVMSEHQIPPAIQEHWVKHTESLRHQVTRDAGGRCDPHAALARTTGAGQPAAEDASQSRDTASSTAGPSTDGQNS